MSDVVKKYTVKCKARIGRMHAARESWETLENPSLEALLTIPADVPAEDAAIEADGEITFLDCDTHHWEEKPTDEALAAWIVDALPRPDAVWVTHGRGLRLVYCGPFHRPRAIAAALSLPGIFKIEFKKESRHPLSTRKGQACGPILYGEIDPETKYEFRLDGNFTEEQRAQALEQLDFDDGKRYGHSRCLLDPHSESIAEESVHVYKNTIFCFRCASAGIVFRNGMAPGVYPLAAVFGAESSTELDRLVLNWVHWPHARLEIKDLYPNISEAILEDAYRLALETKYGFDDPRILSAFKMSNDFVWGSGIWLSAKTFESRTVDPDAAESVPYCQCISKQVSDDGEKKIAIDKSRKSQFRNSIPDGYKPVLPYRGLNLKKDSGKFIPILAPGPQYRVELIRNPVPEEQCFARLEKFFPGLNPSYLKAAIAAGMCAARGGGRKPQLCVDGPTGAGKGETVRLAASFLSDAAPKIRLTGNEEELCRYFGTQIAAGHRYFIMDEFSKVQQLHRKLGILLQFGSKLTWRPLYGEARTDDFDAAIFYTSINFPDWLRQSAEFCRRVRRVRLLLQVPDWNRTVGSDTSEWRNQSPENAKVANSLLTHMFRLCHEHNFNWDAISDALGIGRLSDGADSPGADLYLELYRYCRGEFGPPAIINDGTFIRGWIDLTQGRGMDIVNKLIDYENFDDQKKARFITKNNLESQPWCNMVGFSDPPIFIRVKIHGQKWACRFEAPGPRGNEPVNEQLPPPRAAV